MGASNENDRDGVKLALINMNSKYTNVTKMWGDMGYVSSELKAYIKENYNIDFEIVKRPPCRFWVHKDTPAELIPVREPGFKVEPRRWVIKNRRLSKEYEYLTTSTENLIYLAVSRLMLTRCYR